MTSYRSACIGNAARLRERCFSATRGLFAVDVDDHDFRAFLREAQRRALADALRAAGNDRNLVLQPHVLVPRLVGIVGAEGMTLDAIDASRAVRRCRSANTSVSCRHPLVGRLDQCRIEVLGDEHETGAVGRRVRQRQVDRGMEEPLDAVHADPGFALGVVQHALGSQDAISVQEHEARQPHREP